MFRLLQSYIARHFPLKISSSRRLSWLRNSYKGKRCFIIGNGPSLNIEDLETLKKHNELSIASNKIYLAFRETDWRPQIYTVADWCVAENNTGVVNQLDLFKLFPKEFESFFKTSPHGITAFFNQYVPPHCSDEEYESYFFNDLREGAFVGETITNLNIQIAAHLGCSQIYLLGVDGAYIVPDEKMQHQHYGQVVVSSGEANHFSKDYRMPGETWSIPRVSCHEKNADA